MSGKAYKINLEYIKATDTVKQVCLRRTLVDGSKEDKAVYVLNQDKYDNRFGWNQQDNKTAFKLSNTDQLFRNMYSTDKMFFKSAIYDKSKTERTDTTYDFKNIFSHNISTPYKDVIQVDNTLYAIEDLSPNGHISISSDSYQYLAEDNNSIALTDVDIETCIYNRDYILSVVNGDDTYRSKVVKKIFYGVPYNTMLEFPGNIFNENDSGNIAANAFKGKNQYNSLFNMEHTTALSNCNDNDLLHTRSYIKIDNCNNQLYFKYYDNISCTSADAPVPDAEDPYQPAKQKLSAVAGDQQLFPGLKIQHVETIDYLARYANQYGHKSNLYSIVVKTDDRVFGDDFMKITPGSKITPEDRQHTLDILQNNIKSFVKTVVKKLMPANTQLFQITVQ